MKYCTLILAALPLLTALTTTNHARGGYWGHWNEGGSCCDGDQGNPCCRDTQLIGSDGYNAGIADAVYDHQNNLVYNPIGKCLSCHSQDYWNNFRRTVINPSNILVTLYPSSSSQLFIIY